MAGFFSRLSGGKIGLQTTQNTAFTTEESPKDIEIGKAMTTIGHHGIEDLEFRPIEHPIEPINYDQPIICPLLESSILKDGRICKKKMSSSSAQMRGSLSDVKEGTHFEGKESNRRRHKSAPTSSSIVSSISTPGNDFVELLDECTVEEDRNIGS
ncbi:hypothetical protein HPP92_008851 [Vanilla planifolia]|uniref:Uncharacterized protein n=1 Tax=Vanilla planifolia TaxID=51239 RepID=A0A835R6Q6_VANPL|nr:hypothetical protein HPP92_008851 [Vanilla planifolia]